MAAKLNSQSKYPMSSKIGVFVILLVLVIVLGMSATGTTAKFFAVLETQEPTAEPAEQTPEVTAPASGVFTLLDFPEPFVRNGQFDAVIVVGADASAQDVVTAANFGAVLASFAPNSKVPSAKLDTEVTNKQGGNLILIGGDKVNRLTSELKGINYTANNVTYSSMPSGFEVRVYNNAFGGNYYALTLEGSNPAETARAASAVFTYANQQTASKVSQYCGVSTA